MCRSLFSPRTVIVTALIAWGVAFASGNELLINGSIIDGRTFEDLITEYHTYNPRIWPSNENHNNGGTIYFVQRLANGRSSQTVPADTGIFLSLASSLEWDGSSECLDGPGWDPLSNMIERTDQRLVGHDPRIWLNGEEIQFDWAAARVNLGHQVYYPPGTTGPCIDVEEGPVPRRAGSSGIYAYIPPFPEPGVYTLEYFSPQTDGSNPLRTREFIVQDGLIGDLNRSGAIDAADIDMISIGVREGSVDRLLDRDLNGIVDSDDLSKWLADAGISNGDTDLNGTVDFTDFLALSSAFGGEGGWGNGDFDGNGTVEFPDFLALSDNFGSSTQAAAVPEPAGIGIAVVGALVALGARVQRATPMEVTS